MLKSVKNIKKIYSALTQLIDYTGALDQHTLRLSIIIDHLDHCALGAQIEGQVHYLAGRGEGASEATKLIVVVNVASSRRV